VVGVIISVPETERFFSAAPTFETVAVTLDLSVTSESSINLGADI
jgi:hypothetical protein